MTSDEVCMAIRQGLRNKSHNYEIELHPLADGGDGSIDILNRYLHLQKHKVDTVDPLGRPISTYYFSLEDTAFIELAKSSGLRLLDQDEYNPLFTSTLGTGYIIQDAVQKGYRNIYLFLGGSATNDAGMGIATALGYTFLDNLKKPLLPIGGNLGRVFQISKNAGLEHFSDLQFTLLCDVNNPLYGPNGAAYVFAGQKGADNKMIKKLDEGLQHFAFMLSEYSGKKVAKLPGCGTAGGTPASILTLFNARIKSGIDTFIELTHLAQKIKESDIVISGEGKLDITSTQGKLISGVSHLCKKYEKPLFLFVGKNELPLIDQEALSIKNIFEISDIANGEKDAMNKAKDYLEQLAGAIDFNY